MPLSGILASTWDNVIRMDTELDTYAQTYPWAREALESLQSILHFQPAQAAQLEHGPPMVLDAAHARWKIGLPLLDAEALSVPYPLFRDALVTLRTLLSQRVSAQAVLDRLLESGLVESASVESFLDKLRRNGRDRIAELAATLGVDPEMLFLLLRTVVAPYYEKRAAPYRPWLETFTWRHGYCPICGAEPGLARLIREDGHRILVCSVCRSEWSFGRLRCPYCEADGRAQFRHFTVDDDPVHRVDCCEQCRRYIKTVDERLVQYQTYIPAEELVTAYLDGLAREQGYL
jgi:FdhE protein